ncbi:MAG TPA: glycoside hydrolase family 3 protein [Thermodesulfobacteriota bacterium]|nr:glycoside hydrolase family 3 protein [Thermodesulfobacteriota bacterium]
MRSVKPEELSITEKIGQIVMPRLDFRNEDALPYAEGLVKNFHIGGFIVFGGERERIISATDRLQSISPIPLFFACDAERGVGQIVSGATLFPFAMSLGAIGDEELVYRQAGFIAREMKGCGLNLVFAPVVDVNTNRENPIINIRSYGDDPSLVSRLGTAFIKGCQEEGVLACAKHFPGHGGVAVDSHVTLPSSSQNREDFWRCDLIPFMEAIRTGVSSVMVAHLAVPQIDPTGVPATISVEIIQNLLVGDLEFKGLIVTDSFIMDALSGLGKEQEKIARLSILAGCHIILDPKEPVTLIERLVEMIETGDIPESLLDKAVDDITKVKKKWFYDKPHRNSLDEGYGENLVEEIARRSVCCIKGRRLRSEKAIVYVLDVTQSGGDISRPFLRSLKEAGVTCQKQVITYQDNLKSIPREENGDTAVICLVYTSVAAWKHHSSLPESYKKFLDKASGLHSEKILVSFGSPYVLRGFENFDTVLCAFDRMDSCQRAVADVLLGRLLARGRLPVKLHNSKS